MIERLASLDDEQRRQLETLLVDFDQSWHPRRFHDWRLPSENDPVRRPLLMEMIKIDLERRWERGERPTLEEYVADRPELGNPGCLPADLIVAEIQVRRQFGQMVDYAKRFPAQAAAVDALLRESDALLAGNEIETTNVAKRTDSPRPAIAIKDDSAFQLPNPFGRYRIERVLGEGGMGRVYLAHDTQLERTVALKVPTWPVGLDSEVRQRFLREARAAAALHHPNLCPILDYGELGDIAYLTMAYIQGPSLAERLRAGPRFSAREAVQLVRKTAVALSEAHARGVIHRDLKPSNVVLDLRGEPVIVDFGLARRVGTVDQRLTRDGSMLGTPAYMPPEQIRGEFKKIGAQSDIYSLGAILYELLTGRLPFTGGAGEAIAKALTESPSPPSAVCHEVDSRLDAICLKMLARDPEERFASMNELSSALDQWLGTEVSRTRRAPTIKNEHDGVDSTRTSSVMARRGALLALGVLLVLVTAWAVGWLGPWIANDPSLEHRFAEVHRLKGHAGGVFDVAFRGNGETLMTSDGQRTVRVWSLGSGDEPKATKWDLGPLLTSALFAPDGQRCVASTGSLSELLDLTERSLIRKLNIRSLNCRGAFSANGRRFADDGWELEGRFAFVWDLESGESFQLARQESELTAVALSPDGKQVVSAASDGLRWFDVDTGRELGHFSQDAVRSLLFSQDGKRILCGRALGSVVLIELESGRELGQFVGHANAVTTMAITNDGKRLVSGSIDRTVRVWWMEAREELACLKGHTAAISCVAVSRDGSEIASGDEDGTVRIWK